MTEKTRRHSHFFPRKSKKTAQLQSLMTDDGEGQWYTYNNCRMEYFATYRSLWSEWFASVIKTMYIPIGVAVDTPAGEMVARVALLLCSVDLPARALVTNTKRWNGCLYCESDGVTIGSDHLHRYWPYQPSSRLRSRELLLSNAEMAVTTGNTVRM